MSQRLDDGEITSLAEAELVAAQARLEALRGKLRQLVLGSPTLGEAIRQAFWKYLELGDRYVEAERAAYQREQGLARAVFAQGHLIDRSSSAAGPCLLVRVRASCPPDLATKLEGFRPADVAIEGSDSRSCESRLVDAQGELLPVALEREAAEAALRSLDGAAERGWVPFDWRVWVTEPPDWASPVDPGSLERRHLARLSDEDYLTVALYRLGGLADLGTTRPIVGEPDATGDPLRDVPAYAAWRARFPAPWDDHDSPSPRIDPSQLPPEIAEEMLAFVERRWNVRSQEEPSIARAAQAPPPAGSWDSDPPAGDSDAATSHRPGVDPAGPVVAPDAESQPRERTQPAPLARVAGALEMDPRTLKRMIEDGTVWADKVSPRKWVFDRDQLAKLVGFDAGRLDALDHMSKGSPKRH